MATLSNERYVTATRVSVAAVRYTIRRCKRAISVEKPGKLEKENKENMGDANDNRNPNTQDRGLLSNLAGFALGAGGRYPYNHVGYPSAYPPPAYPPYGYSPGYLPAAYPYPDVYAPTVYPPPPGYPTHGYLPSGYPAPYHPGARGIAPLLAGGAAAAAAAYGLHNLTHGHHHHHHHGGYMGHHHHHGGFFGHHHHGKHWKHGRYKWK